MCRLSQSRWWVLSAATNSFPEKFFSRAFWLKYERILCDTTYTSGIASSDYQASMCARRRNDRRFHTTYTPFRRRRIRLPACLPACLPTTERDELTDSFGRCYQLRRPQVSRDEVSREAISRSTPAVRVIVVEATILIHSRPHSRSAKNRIRNRRNFPIYDNKPGEGKRFEYSVQSGKCFSRSDEKIPIDTFDESLK